MSSVARVPVPPPPRRCTLVVMDTGEPDRQRQVDELRARLERELDAAAPPLVGCWPLVVGLAGVALAVALLVALL